MDLPNLETDRLYLRKLEMSDLDAVFKITSNPNITAYLGMETHSSRNDTSKYLNSIISHYENGLIEFAICLKDNPQCLCGIGGAFWVSRKNKTIELEGLLAEEFWGKGYMVEALETTINFCWDNLDVVRIQAKCVKGHRQSRRILEKLGMTYEGTLHSSLFKNGRSMDMEIFCSMK